MSKVIAITTVGTSIFDNYYEYKKKVNIQYYDALSKKIDYAKKDESTISKKIEHFKSDVSSKIDSFIKEEKEKSCAEFKTLSKLGIQETYLLCTETILGELAGEVLATKVLPKHSISVKKLKTINGLNVTEKNAADTFKEKGILNLIQAIKEIKDAENGNDVRLIVSGGYKALLPILTVIGQLEDIPLEYIYEDSEEVIEIPKLPINFDWSVIEDDFIAFEGLSKNEKNLLNESEFKKELNENDKFEELKEQKIIQINSDNKVHFTWLGKWMFTLYEKLYNSENFSRQNIVSKIVELKIYEYYNDIKKIQKVKCGQPIDGYDIDVYCESNDEVNAIEVKPGGNIPIKNKKSNENSIENNLKERAFKKLVEKYKDSPKKIIFKLILYHHKDIHESALKQLEELFKEVTFERNVTLEVVLLKLTKDYKKDVSWKVSDERLTLLKSFQKTPLN